MPDAADPAPDAPFPDDAVKWAACLRRDRRADGQFFAGVRTTGVYCRPSCPGRPKRENVRFYATPIEARAAGLRACKRCKPDAAVAGTHAPGP